MKVCFLSSMHPATDKRVFDKEARLLSGAGFVIVHACPDDEPSRSLDGIRLETYPRPGSIWERLVGLMDLFRIGRRMKADVYHCNELDSWFVGLLLKLLYRKKVVVDIHEYYPSMFDHTRCPFVLRPLAGAAVRWYQRLLARVTDHIVLAKHSGASDFRGCEKKLSFVLNFASLRTKDRRVEDVSPALRKTFSGGVTAVSFGLIGKNRGWPQLVEALRRAKSENLRLLFLGRINDGSEDELHRTVEAAGLAERIRFENWKPFHEAFDYLLCCNIGVVSFQSHELATVYAMPHKMFDYMLAGIPVIIPDFTLEIAQIVKECECGLLVDTANPDQIASALDRLCQDPELCKRLGENGRQAVIRRYNWETEGTELLRVYERLGTMRNRR